jgi:oligopeptide transport system substrate-binding protein
MPYFFRFIPMISNTKTHTPVSYITFGLVCVLLLFAGCSEAPISSQTLRVANDAEPQTIDPHRCTGHPGIRVIGALFEGLVTRGANGSGVQPGIAHSWDISQDGKIYTFYLRPTKWSNGTSLTASDIARSWKRFLDPNTGAEYASLLDIILNAKQVMQRQMPLDSLGIKAPDDSTFVVHLEHPTGYFLELCAFEPLVPVPLSQIQKYQEKWTSITNIQSNGPYILTEWKLNQYMKLSKNPHYWDKDAVKQDTILLYPITEAETSYKMFLNQEIDWVFKIPLNKMQWISKKSEYLNYTQYGVYYYSINIQDTLLSNIHLRKALAYAIDREKIVKHITKGEEPPATGFVPILPSIPYAGTGISLYNLEKAKAYLEEAKKDVSLRNLRNLELELLYNTSENHKKIAEVVGQMWKETLGISVRLRNMEWKTYLQETKAKRYQVARASWIADYPDPYSFLELGVSTNPNNRSGYNNPKYDSCIRSSQSITSSEKRFAQLTTCEDILMEDMPIIPLYYYTNKELRHKGIQGATPNPMGMYNWKYVHILRDE